MATRLQCSVDAAPDIVLAVAVAGVHQVVDEDLVVTVDGRRIAVEEIADAHGGRLHRAPAVPSGSLVVEYAATVVSAAPIPVADDLDAIRYLRPSRYCESDQLAPVARAEFFGLDGANLLHAVTSWVGTRVAYVAGSSQPIDGAVATYLARRGVCRDFAHLVVALLRACDVPARLVSVYAPGLVPMDFHAVAEAYVDGCWFVVDATCLAPRSAMVRIATGRDAADAAFITTSRGSLELIDMSVRAHTDGVLPRDDATELVVLR